MEIKKQISIFLLTLMMLITTISAADYYVYYEFNYNGETPSDIFAIGGDCSSNSCEDVNYNNQAVSFYESDAQVCLGVANSDLMDDCVEEYAIDGNIIPNDNVIIKFTDEFTRSSKFNVNFHTSEDSYIPMFSTKEDFSDAALDDIQQYGYGFQGIAESVNFEKVENAIAEVNNFDVENIDDSLNPVQINVPITISESVCSAVSRTNQMDIGYNIPNGYSDFEIDTLLKLQIFRLSNNNLLHEENLTIPILADHCAGLEDSFTWIPDEASGLEEYEELNFRIESHILDNQVASSFISWAEAEETIYPENLADTCWVRVNDFKLMNDPTSELSTSTSQVTIGEDLYTEFEGGAFYGEDRTSMDYNVEIYFNNTLVADYGDLTTPNNAQEGDLISIIRGLSDEIEDLESGAYTVELVAYPNVDNNQCSFTSSVTKTLDLRLLEPDLGSLEFTVTDQYANNIENAQIDLTLVEPYNYNDDLTYNNILSTDSNGIVMFNDLYRGEYEYEVSHQDYATTTNTINVAGDMLTTVILYNDNRAPAIDLPNELMTNYEIPVSIELGEYVRDNSDFEDLSFDFELLSGVGNASISNGNITFDSTQNNNGLNNTNYAIFNVVVTDPEGLSDNDNITINYTQNTAPVINDFSATPQTGNIPFTTTFNIDVEDSDSSNLTCTIDYGNGNGQTADCDLLDDTTYTYQNAGTYTIELTVEDSLTQVSEEITIYAYNRTAPVINSFSMVSSNGYNLPTDLLFTWDVTHDQNLDMDCSLRINGNAYDVDCIGTFNINNFNTEGVSRFSIVATDENGISNSRTINRTFTRQYYPVINNFNLDSSNDNYLPTNLTLTWDVTHNAGWDMSCYLNINGNQNEVNCSDSEYIENFTRRGHSTFELIAIDNVSTRVTEIIERDFYSQADQLGHNTTVDLLLDDIIEPGEFDFKIATTNETLARRYIYVKPVIDCGFKNTLKDNNGFLSTAAVSENKGNIHVFDLKTNTMDFVNNVPTDQTCTFRVFLEDSIGSTFTLEEPVMFRYTKEEEKFTSIRGYGVDVLNYMSSTLESGAIKTGFNSIDFNVVNNQNSEKELSISVISSDLGIDAKEEISLGAGQTRNIQIPMYISKDTQDGMYPVRYAVRDNEDKQVKYSYILID